MKAVRIILATAVLFAAIFVAFSGRFLVLNQPQKSDVIVVLAGETQQRPARGLKLLIQGFAPRLVLDVPTATIYDKSQLDLAQDYVKTLPQANAISICPIYERSTKGEARDVSRCLKGSEAQKVLLVTSDYHTRRALSIFRHVLPQYRYSVAAASDEREYATSWWQRRQWAKVNFDEWIRLVWWELVERWT